MSATDRAAPSSHVLVRWLFVRLVALVFVCAFLSLAVQLRGLIGERGILPARELTEIVSERLGTARWWRFPSLVWLTGASDGGLLAITGLGLAGSIAAIAGLAPAIGLAVAWLCYLSLFHVGQEFLGFQWDLLLLETGVLAILYAPWTLRSRLSTDPAPSPLVLGLIRFLLFKLMFLSGVVKLASQDPTWRDLTALTYHFETQPLPTWVGWFAHHLPRLVLEGACLATFVIELGAPWLILAGRMGRRIACGAFTLLMVVIGITGNYTFFNVLALVLSLTLLDDHDVRALLPRRWRTRLDAPVPSPPAGWVIFVRRALAVGLIVTNLCVVAGAETGSLAGPLVALWRVSEPFASVNTYGLFATMTRDRPEIVIEGSDDGETWREYDLPWKPGPLDRRPRFVEPHQPRLDWQLWFAALGPSRSRYWVARLLDRLREGSPAVVGLFQSNPFPDAPPRYARALLYDYRFTDWATWRDTGRWWDRRLIRLYLTSSGPTR